MAIQKTKASKQEEQPVVKKQFNNMVLAGFSLGMISSVVGEYFALLPIAALTISAIGLAQYDPKKEKGRVLGYAGLLAGVIYTYAAVM